MVIYGSSSRYEFGGLKMSAGIMEQAVHSGVLLVDLLAFLDESNGVPTKTK